jgi:excisionase family DNA binding protein
MLLYAKRYQKNGGDVVMEKIYTPEMAAEMLHVSTLTLRKWLRSGQLTGIKVGRQWRIRESDLNLLFEHGQRDEQQAD